MQNHTEAYFQQKINQLVVNYILQQKHNFNFTYKMKTDTYFIESGDKISFFFEEDAFDENGKLKRAKSESINKIGHGLKLHFFVG